MLMKQVITTYLYSGTSMTASGDTYQSQVIACLYARDR